MFEVMEVGLQNGFDNSSLGTVFTFLPRIVLHHVQEIQSNLPSLVIRNLISIFILTSTSLSVHQWRQTLTVRFTKGTDRTLW
jgi:hypothetical protein